MTVIPVTIGKRNAQGNATNAQRGAFIDSQQPMTNQTPAFKANEPQKDSFGKKPKESWAYRYRSIIGFFAGMVAGSVIWNKVLVSRLEKMKNMTNFKANVINISLNIFLGYLGSAVALQIGKDKQ